MNKPNKWARMILGLLGIAVGLYIVGFWVWGWIFYDRAPNGDGYTSMLFGFVVLFLSLMLFWTKR